MEYPLVNNFPANQVLSDKLKKRLDQDALRFTTINKGLVDFCSNDYLGFSKLDFHRESIRKEFDNIIGLNKKSSGQGSINLNGSTGSRLISGNSEVIEELERFIAKYHKAEAGLIFNSGYAANLGLFSAIGLRGDTFIYDELIHASVHDGMRLSLAHSFPFKHNDLKHLEERLKKANGNCYVAVESVYSMDGDFSPLKEIAKLCHNYQANLIVDEAHATGIFGDMGVGRVVENNLQDRVFAKVHTFGKALGSHGAIVLGNKLLRDFLINFSRPFIYSTALPLHSLLSIKCAYRSLHELSDCQLELKEKISLFKKKISRFPFSTIDSYSPIQAIVIGGNAETKSLAKEIQNDGFDVRAILSPTVAKGKERLRICLHTYNSEEEIQGLIQSITNNHKRLFL